MPKAGSQIVKHGNLRHDFAAGCRVVLSSAGANAASNSYRSCPAYERLKLLLHSGKSEIWLPGIAADSALQL